MPALPSFVFRFLLSHWTRDDSVVPASGSYTSMLRTRPARRIHVYNPSPLDSARGGTHFNPVPLRLLSPSVRPSPQVLVMPRYDPFVRWRSFENAASLSLLFPLRFFAFPSRTLDHTRTHINTTVDLPSVLLYSIYYPSLTSPQL